MQITFSAPARAIALVTTATAALVVGSAGVAGADTTVPGHQGRDGVVTGKYTEQNAGCDYQVIYRGDFGGDPYLDNGWITNIIDCGKGQRYKYTFVHETDPRYTGDPDRAIWGTWEYHVFTASGSGNIANPMHPEYFVG